MSVTAHRVARYYRHLFHLPTLSGILLRWLLILSLISAAAGVISTNLILARWPVGFAALAAIPWVVKRADEDNILFTPRRGFFLEYIQLLCMSGFMIIALAAHWSLAPGREVAIGLLGLSSTMVFIMVVAAGVFFDSSWQALLYSLTQTTALALVILDPVQVWSYASSQPIFVLLISALVALGISFLTFLKSRGRAVFRQDPLTVLKYFMQTWSENSPGNLERWLDTWSEPSLITSYIIRFRGRAKRLLWVVPGIHPGPFAPVGSYNLPARIVDTIRPEANCVVFHGAVEHDTNLPSQHEVEKFLKALKEGGKRITHRGEFAGPKFGQQGNRRFAAIRIDLVALVAISYSDEATDDLPTWMREEITQRAQKLGYKDAIVIDAHNSVSHPSLTENDPKQLLDEVEKALGDLHVQGINRLSIGTASTRSRNLKEDIGDAGISITTVGGPPKPSAFIVVDSNNIQLEAGRTIESACKELFSDSFILCTTDTHQNAARVLGRRGYILAGDRTPAQNIVSEIRELAARATSKFEDVFVEVEAITVQLRIMGEDVLRRSFKGVSQLTRMAKNTAYGLGLYTLLLLIAVLLI